MKILITGATGFLGSHLCRRLVAEGHDVTVFRRPASTFDAAAESNLRQRFGDVTDLVSVRAAVRGHEAVIHAAACLPRQSLSKEALYQVNVTGTKNVVEACIQTNVPRLLHVSSVAAVGIPNDASHPANEEFPFNLEHSRLHYHISKHRAESVVLEGVRRGLNAVIVNPTGLSGPAAAYYRGTEIISQVRRRTILPYSPGGVCVAHVDDVVEGIIAALHSGAAGHRYILGGENLTFHQMLERTAALLRVKRAYIPIPAAATKLLAAAAQWSPAARRLGLSPSHPRYYCAARYSFYDSTKAQAAFGYSARPFEAILEESLRFKTRAQAHA